MKILIDDVQEIVGPKIRFALTFVDDDGEPLLTYPGWTLNQKREIASPATLTRYGKYHRFSSISPRFEVLLRGAVESFEEVEKVLGPALPGESVPRKIGGKREIS
jgi:hypothetical protein